MTLEQQLLSTPAFRGETGFLSNFAPYQYDSDEFFDFEGIKYPSNEHYYQAQKFSDPELKQRIANHPFKGLKSFCRQFEIKPYWDQVKDDVMMVGLIYKFSIPRFAKALKATGDLELIERNNWGDKYWGVCESMGQNKLGKMLMEIRSKL